MSSPFDLLLSWISEHGTGTWSEFKLAHAWVFGNRNDRALQKPGWTALLLATLGHMEISWETERWGAAQPCLVNITSAGGIAVLAGSRPRSMMVELDKALDDDEFDVVRSDVTPSGGPAVIYLQYGTEGDLLALAERIGARFERYAARTLLLTLPSVEDRITKSRIAADPPRGFDLSKFITTFLRWDTVLAPNSDGLFRYRAFGHDRFWLRRSGVTREVDKDYGMWAALAADKCSVVTHRAEDFTGRLVVPMRTALPLLHARVAVLCSGQPPLIDPQSGTIQYMNIPTAMARKLAVSLGQVLKEE